MKKLILPGFLIGLAYYFFNKAKTNVQELAQSLTILPAGIDFNLKNVFLPKIILKFEANNPTPTPAIINKIYATITNNGNQFATINNNDNITITANGITTIPIQLNVDTLSILENINDLSTKFIVNGYAISGLAKINFSKELNVKLPL